MKAVEKRFGGVTALRDGNLRVEAGEVHLLMGENGAGKSTLMKILAGMYQADGGEIRWRGEAVRFARPADAAAQGIAMVHQESLLAPQLSVAENLFMGRLPRLRVSVSSTAGEWNGARPASSSEHKFPLDAAWRVEKLSPAQKQLVEICRAILHGSSLLIFDEPTSSLSDSESQEVFRIVGELRGAASA